MIRRLREARAERRLHRPADPNCIRSTSKARKKRTGRPPVCSYCTLARVLNTPEEA